MTPGNDHPFFLTATPKKHLDSIEQQSFWQTIEQHLRGKKIHPKQKVDTAVAFRFMILQEVFNVKLDDLKRDVEHEKKLSFIYNLQENLPTEEDISFLKGLLVEKGYYDVIIERCRVHLHQLKTEERQKQNINLTYCPNCNSLHLFNLKPTIKQKLFGYRSYRCFECKTEFEKPKNSKHQKPGYNKVQENTAKVRL
jgi:DNA-directed RNA polymerase subunit RPC12/RpoP